MNNERMPKNSDCHNGIMKRGRLWEGLADEGGEYLKIMGIRN
jgi:hypothetical protein